MSIEANKKLAVEFFAHFKKKEMDQALARCTDDLVWRVPGKPELLPIAGEKNKAEIGEVLNGVVVQSKDGVDVRVLGMTAEADRVAVEAESFGILGNGRHYNNQYHFLLTFRDGKIARIHEYLDTLHVADVLKG